MALARARGTGARGLTMKLRTVLGLLLGVAVLTGTLAYAGVAAVTRTFEGLGLWGLLALALAHVPVEAFLGLAWRLACGGAGASPRRFLWARFVRVAAAETLPFSQIGGFVLGVRALRLQGSAALRGVLSMCVDLVVELMAKLPYVFAATCLLLALSPRSDLARPLGLGLLVTAFAVAAALLAGRRMGGALAGLARRIAGRWPVLASLDRLHGEGDASATLTALLARRRELRLAFGLHLLCWFAGAAELWLAFWLLGRPVTAGEALVIDGAVAGLRTFVFMVPAAAGVQEASYVLAASVFGIPPAAAVAASFARRARDLTLGAGTLAVAAATDPGLRRLGVRARRAARRGESGAPGS